MATAAEIQAAKLMMGGPFTITIAGGEVGPAQRFTQTGGRWTMSQRHERGEGGWTRPMPCDSVIWPTMDAIVSEDALSRQLRAA